MTADFSASQFDDETAYEDINRLHELGNQAVAAGLIIGHGHRQGSYEILRTGAALTFSPPAAVEYLETLLRSEGEAS